MDDRVEVTVDDGVATLWLCRPDRSNALDGAMFDALTAAGERLRTMPNLRAVILAGKGRGFCAGLDRGLFDRMHTGTLDGVADLEARTCKGWNRFQSAAWIWRDLKMPVIAAVHGFAVGGGLELALGADLRYVAPGARLSVMEVDWGLVPGMGGTVLMQELARPDIVRELAYTGREFSGAEAVAYGLATRTANDPYACALDVAHEIAAKSADSVQALKRLLLPREDPWVERKLVAEARELQALIGTPNQLAAVAAGFRASGAG